MSLKPPLYLAAFALLGVLVPTVASADNAKTARITTSCSREATFTDVTRKLKELETDASLETSAVVRRSVILDATVGPRSEFARVVIACPGDSTSRATRAIVHSDLLRLWANTIALRALDAPIYPAPYDPACQAYDLASVRYDARKAWVDRYDSQGWEISRADLWRAMASDTLYAHVASLASTRLREVGETSLPSFETDEVSWLAEASTRRDFALAALPRGEHCGPLYALYGVEPEAAAFALLRHRSNGTRQTALR